MPLSDLIPGFESGYDLAARGERRCVACWIPKPLEEFGKSHAQGGPGGRSHRCKLCAHAPKRNGSLRGKDPGFHQKFET